MKVDDLGGSVNSPQRIRLSCGLEVVEGRRGGIQLVGEQVPVAVQGKGRGAVPELTLDGLDRAAGADGERRRRVSQIVDAQRRGSKTDSRAAESKTRRFQLVPLTSAMAFDLPREWQGRLHSEANIACRLILHIDHAETAPGGPVRWRSRWLEVQAISD